MKTGEMTIGEVAGAAGMRPSALRYYEGVGVLPPPQRQNGRRRYDGSIFAYLAAIQLAQESGFTVAEIKQLLESCGSLPPAPAGGTATPSGPRPRKTGAGPAGRPDRAGRGWQQLAQAKIEELDRTIARASAMKRLLSQWLECECVSLADCELVAARLQRPAKKIEVKGPPAR